MGIGEFGSLFFGLGFEGAACWVDWEREEWCIGGRVGEGEGVAVRRNDGMDCKVVRGRYANCSLQHYPQSLHTPQ
jgi:hypothetical protein